MRQLSVHVPQLVCTLLLASLVCLGAAAPAPAQTAVTAAVLTGYVGDPMASAVGNARVLTTNLATGQHWLALTSNDGRFRFMSLPPGRYEIVAERDGFQPCQRDVTLAAGASLDVPLTLLMAQMTTSVSVRAELQVVDTTRTQSAELVSPEQIGSLPLNGRNYLDLALLTPGASRTNTRSTERFAETSAVPGTGLSINGQRNLSNTFLVDGLSANDDAAGLAGTFLSEEVIREFQVVNSGGVAEFGRAAGGAVSIVTQSGTDHLRGNGYSYGRNGRLDARNPLAVRKDPLSQWQYGLTLGGPLPGDSLFGFANVEQTRQTRRGLVTIAPAAVAAIDAALDRFGYSGPRPATGDYSTGYDTTNAFARIDRQLHSGARLTARYSYYSLSSQNARNAGGLNDVSRGTALDDRDHSWAIGLVLPLSSTLLNDARAQATRSRLAAAPNDLVGPAVNISGVASISTSTSSPTARNADAYELADSLSWQHGLHLVKGGVDALLNRVTIVFPGAMQGVYTFASLASLQSGKYINFQQAFGVASQFQSNPNLGAYLQDEWRLRRDVTINAGLRYDLQWLPSPMATNTRDVSPRLGIAWAPGSRRTIVRASGGLFYDRLPLRAVSNALQRDGINYKVAVLSYGQAGAPAFPQVMDRYPAAVLSAVTTIDPRARPARTAQENVQVEQRLGNHSALTLTYTHLDGRHILMSRNINAPTLTAAQATALGVPNLGRPNPNFGNISRYEAIGASRYDGVTASLTLHSARWGQLRVAYTLSKSLDDTGNFFFSTPQDNGNVRADWGLSDNDQRHRLVVSGSQETGRATGTGFWNRLRADWQVAYIFSYASALPFNIQTGTDLNGDTNVNDRPAGVSRNTGKGFSSATLDLRLSRRLRAGGRVVVEAVADAFNARNRANLEIPNNIIGTGVTPLPTFGQATAAGDPRQFQLGIRVTF